MRRMLTAVPLLLVAAALTACGGSGEDGPGVATVGNNASASASPDPSAPAADEEERRRQFAACMREEGIEIPEGTEGGGGVKIEAGGKGGGQKTKTAVEKCRKYLPNGGEPPTLSPEQLEQMREYAKCMRENGMPDFPDPDPANGGIAAIPADGRSKEAIEKANDACRDKMPQFKMGGGK